MSLKESIRSKIFSTPRRAILIAAMILLAIGGLVTAAVALPPMGAYDLLITAAAQANQAGGFCSTTAQTPTCREWCLTTMEGIVIPQGQFVCVDE